MTTLGEQLASACRDFEKKTGMPQLSKLAGVLETKLPDERQMKLFIELLDRLERISKIAPDVDKVLALAHELNGLSSERLKILNTTLLRLEHIMEKTPKEIIDFISGFTQQK